jgi:hypothetical protein
MNDKDNSIVNSEDYKAMLKHKGIAPTVNVAAAPTAPVAKPARVNEPIRPPVIAEEKVKVPKTPLWPVEPEQMELWKQERVAHDLKVEAFLKEIESPSHIEAVQASGRASAQKKMEMAPRAKVHEEVKEPIIKTPKAKKESRQTRLGQTKMIDDLLKAGKTEKEVFDTVRIKIPEYPADKLPKLIKLRQYHVKK